eukprot:m.7583 g.7583  ORF g.7583 m.7583 type:complete len:236 (+) comp6760_c0_seq1:41-748(+)
MLRVFVVCVVVLVASARAFDVFLYVNQWPPALCATTPASQGCKIPKIVKGWTIHGLWASNTEGTDPSYCDPSKPFNWADISSLAPQLNTSWPNLFTNTEYTSFWSHEWEKHGTCAESVSALSDEFKFFDETLGLHEKYDVLSTLSAGGITPSAYATYKLADIQNAIHTKFGVTPVVYCSYDSSTKKATLLQVAVCFSKSLEIIACADSILKQATCETTDEIIYLPLDSVPKPMLG